MGIFSITDQEPLDTSGLMQFFADPMIRDGSLAVVDWTSELNPSPSGVPAGTAINLAAVPSAALTGGSATLSITNSMSAESGVMQRTTKGGLHGILSHVTDLTSKTFSLNSTDIANYVGGSTHTFYISEWGVITRAAARASNAAMYMSGLRTTSNDHLAIRPSGTPTPTSILVSPTGSIIGSQTASYTVGTPYFAAGARVGVSATLSSQLMRWATYGTDLHKEQSRIHYRSTLMDLTAAGLTYSQALAMDQQLYTKHVLTTGGRYYGDSWNTPATVLP